MKSIIEQIRDCLCDGLKAKKDRGEFSNNNFEVMTSWNVDESYQDMFHSNGFATGRLWIVPEVEQLDRVSRGNTFQELFRFNVVLVYPSSQDDVVSGYVTLRQEIISALLEISATQNYTLVKVKTGEGTHGGIFSIVSFAENCCFSAMHVDFQGANIY